MAPCSTILPVVHHDDPVGERVDDCQVVADEQAGEAEVALQAAQQLEHRRLHRHVERRCRLVGDEQLGLRARGRGRCPRAASGRRTARAGSGCGTPGAVRRRRADPAPACPGLDPWPRPRAASARRSTRRSAVAGSATTTGPGTRCRRPCAPCAAGGGRPWRCRCRRPSRVPSAIGRRPMAARPTVVLPEPDSPTRPVTSPG